MCGGHDETYMFEGCIFKSRYDEVIEVLRACLPISSVCVSLAVLYSPESHSLHLIDPQYDQVGLDENLLVHPR
jgi:hypothetical protein